MPSYVSSEVNHCIFCGQSHVCGCQERNFGNVHYLRDLCRHALGVQMRHAVSSGISLHATRPAQPISLGTFDPFSDMAIFGLSEMNNCLNWKINCDDLSSVSSTTAVQI